MENNKIKQDAIKYLALGDSYTIGEAVDQKDSWPFLLKDKLEKNKLVSINDPLVIAKTGWTTDELLHAVEHADLTGQNFDVVSLLIGVNNQYRGYPLDQYQKEFRRLLKHAISFTKDHNPNKVFVVSIPDYGVTPFGQKMDPIKIDAELKVNNQIAQNIAQDLAVKFIDIFEISKQALQNPEMTATDDLHPSGLMYKAWIDEIYPFVHQLFQRS